MRKYKCIALCVVMLIAGCERIRPSESYSSMREREEAWKNEQDKLERTQERQESKTPSPSDLSYSYKSAVPTYPFHFVYYKPGVDVKQARKDSDKITMDIYQNTPTYKLSMYWDPMYQLRMEELGYIGTNHPFLPEGYVIDRSNSRWVAGWR